MPVRGYEGLYAVSDLGRVRSFWMGGETMRPSSNGRGYLQVNLTGRDGSKRRAYVHRMVLSSFSGAEGVLDVNHRNGDKRDNRLSNLEWCTRSENHLHRYSSLGQASPMVGKEGEAHPKAGTYLVTKPDGTSETIRGLSKFCRENGLSQPMMSGVVTGKYDSHRGYRCVRLS